MRFVFSAVLTILTIHVLISQEISDDKLLNASKNCDRAEVINLIEKGHSINSADSNNATPLMWAVYCNDTELVKYLIEHGASTAINGVIYIDTTGSYYGNLTCIAAANGNSSLLQYLIEDCEIPVDDREFSKEDNKKSGWTALQWAAYNGKTNCLGYLLSQGADINTNHSMYRLTPLLLAVMGGNEEAMMILASNGADINITDNNGWSPLHYACRDGYTDALSKMLDFNPEINLKVQSGYTALMLAAYNGEYEICELLVNKGADIRIESEEEKSAIDYATLNNHIEVINFLNDPKGYERKLNWSEINSKFLKAFRQREFEKSLEYAKQAEKQASKEFGKNHLNYSVALNNLAVASEMNGYYDDALKSYERSLAIKEGITGKEHEDYIFALKNLGGTYSKLNQFDKSINCFKEVCQLRLKLNGENDFDYLNDLIYLSNTYKKFREFGKADSALSIIILNLENKEELDDSFFELKVNSIRGRGFIYKQKRDYPKAEELYLEALETVKARHGEYHKQYALSLEYLANAYYDGDKVDEAVSAFKRIIEINRFLYGDKNYTYAYDLSNLGNVYDYKGEYLLADSILNLAHDVALDALGEKNPEYVPFLIDLAIMYKNHGQNDKANTFYKKALDIRKDLLGEQHPDYINTLRSLAGNYGTMENFEEAFKYYQEVMALQKEVFGENSLEYSGTLNNMGMLYKTKGDLDESYKYLSEALLIREKELGDMSFEFAVTLSGIAGVYQYWSQFDTAEVLFEKVLHVDTVLYGPNSITASLDYYNLGLLYQETGQYKKAAEVFIKTLDIRKNVLGEKHKDIAQSLTVIGLNYEYLGDYSKAREYLNNALMLVKEIYGTHHIKYGNALMKIAVLDNLEGDYPNAESRMLLALDIYKSTYGEDNWLYGRALNSLSGLYRNVGNFSRSEEILLEIKDIYENSIGTENDTYKNLLNNLGVFYKETGDYKAAEKWFLLALELNNKIFDEKNDGYANIITSLAMNYEYLGNYEKAKELYLESMEIRRELFGEDNIDYADTKNGLGVYFDKMGEYQESLRHLNDALEIYKNVVGVKSPQYIISLSNLSITYNHLGNQEQAMQCAQQALNLKEEIYGKDHPDYALGLNNLAVLVKNQNKLNYAIELYEEAVEIRKKTLGIHHPTIPIYLNNLADTYEATGDNESAEKYYLESNECMLNMIQVQFSFLSEEEKKYFIDDIKYRFDIYHSFFYRNANSNPRLVGDSYNNALTMKGLLLKAEQQVRSTILNSGDISLINKYDQWSRVKEEIASLYAMPAKDNQEYIDGLEDEAIALEKDLARLSDEFAQSNKSTDSWDDIQKQLNKSEATVEFIRFQYYDKRWTDSTFYCALVLKKDFKYPQIIPLFEEKELQASIQQSNNENTVNLVAQLYGEKRGAGQLNVEESISYTDTVLYSMIWKPLEGYLKDVENVFYSPSGLLHKISFAAIPCNDSLYLSDRYALNYLGSSGSLTEKNKQVNFTDQDIDAVVYGGIEYNVNEDEMVMESNKYSGVEDNLLAINRSSSFSNETRGMVWNYLQGTLTEANNIKQQLERNNIKASMYSSKEANEESFKSLSGHDAPEIIHLATHGFFFPDPKQEYTMEMQNQENRSVFQHSENPLLRSGIILAGGNNIWSGEELTAGIEDGILTALEVSNMNLSNTKLVVLSACETGLGDIQGSEGVYGLQRAFKMAGVDYLIMSLWQVPDKETMEFMDIFYGEWLASNNIREAFSHAQKEMKKKYDPFYWAAFVLIE